MLILILRGWDPSKLVFWVNLINFEVSVWELISPVYCNVDKPPITTPSGGGGSGYSVFTCAYGHPLRGWGQWLLWMVTILMHTVNGHTCLFDHQIPPINSCSSISTESSLISIGWRLTRPCAISPDFFCFDLFGPWAFCHLLVPEQFFFCIFLEQLLTREFCLCAFIWSTVQVGSCMVLKTDRLAVQATGPPWVGCLAFAV